MLEKLRARQKAVKKNYEVDDEEFVIHFEHLNHFFGTLIDNLFAQNFCRCERGARQKTMKLSSRSSPNFYTGASKLIQRKAFHEKRNRLRHENP